MPHSLRAKIKGLRYKRIITEKDCDRLCNALDKENVLDKIRAEIEQLPSVNPQEHRDMEEIREVMSCDADAETKCKMISNILTAKPHYFEEQEPRTGHWIRVIDDTGYIVWECDKCGWQQILFYTNFCPYCGAKMVEPQESEDNNDW